MRLSGTRLWALVLACVFLGSLAVGSVSNNVVIAEQTDEPRPTAPSPRTVILEDFTGTWCPPCANAGPALTRIADEYPADQLVMISYHVGGSDPYSDTSVTDPRRNLYVGGILYVPSIIVNGGGPGSTSTLWRIGAGGDRGANYMSYRSMIDAQLTVNTNLQITLDGDLTSSGASVTATIYASDPVTETQLNTRFVLYEDTLYYMGSNGEPFHRYVARALYQIPLTISMGNTIVVSHTFSLDPAWDKNRMGVVAFVQSDIRNGPWQYNGQNFYNSPILQAAKIHFTHPNTLYVKDEGTAADYTDYLDKNMAFVDRPFHAYNKLDMADSGTTDIRGTPTRAEMEEYGAVIWNVGSTIPTLDPTNIADVSGYLDGFGNFFLQGENIGQDLGATSFFSDYLHASTDTAPPATWVQGVAGDPITDAWSSAQLSFSGSSPDGLAPLSGAAKILVFPGGVGGALRADHDSDSRVVSFGINYFQGSDARRNLMIDNILTWLDGASSPKVTLTSFNGGDEFSPGEIAPITWKAVDVEIPANGVDLYYTTSLSSPSWTLISSSQPNDGLHFWTLPGVNTNDCGVRVVVRDGDPITPDGEAISAGPCTIGNPDVQINKDVSNLVPQVTEIIYYTITLSNLGAVTGFATMTDALPSDVTYISDTGHLSGSSAYFAGNTTVVWTGQVPPMSNVIIQINVSVNTNPPGTVVSNWAFFNSTDRKGGTPQSGQDSADYQIPTLVNWWIDLPPVGVSGRYLMSIPLQLIDYRVEFVLASIAGKYSYVRAYDANDPVNPWKSYVPGRTHNSLKEIRIGTSFWIEITTPGQLFLTGARPITTNVQLKAGWNLVGYPSLLTTYTVGQLKADIGLPGIIMNGFDKDSTPYNLQLLSDSYIMTEGEGYWVYVPSDTIWSVSG